MSVFGKGGPELIQIRATPFKRIYKMVLAALLLTFSKRGRLPPFKNNGHSPNIIVIQPVEKIIYDPNSSPRFKDIKRHETELNWMKFFAITFSFRL